MWNDTDIPLGYLITFRCYGTWLHGDERGAIDRFHNRYKSPYLPPSARRKTLADRQLKSSPVTLNASQRRTVESAICEVCDHRKWSLHAVSVRTNHVHSVVSIGREKPERALKCAKKESGKRPTVHGQIEGVRDTCGMSGVWLLRSTMC